ncbi:hypothetical protein SVAN01_11933 [Stagonosporopsis vannaccii]|nr:hypothetical protein SVAN01_11933 [Stagonosporopsis vannaccii]
MAHPSVGKRKAHTKSRKGCFQCKQRHTKCNEARPRCANCVRLDIICAFPPPAPDSYSTPWLSSPGTRDPPVADRQSEDSPASAAAAATNVSEFPIADLRLLYHWTSTCANSLQPFATATDIWAKDLVELGFQFPFLLRGFLALSAVHKASCLRPTDRQVLLHTADLHISQSLKTYRTHLENLSLDTAIPMFIFSSIIFTYNLASSQLEEPEDPIRALHHGFMLLQGINVVLAPHWEYIKDDPIIIRTTKATSLRNLQASEILTVEDIPEEILHLDELMDILPDHADKLACTTAVHRLHEIWMRLRCLSPKEDEYNLLFQWPAQVGDRFLDLLADREPVTCIITAHFAAIMAQCRPVWWAFKWPRWLLVAVEHLLVTMPALLKWLAWPQQIINNQTLNMVVALDAV